MAAAQSAEGRNVLFKLVSLMPIQLENDWRAQPLDNVSVTQRADDRLTCQILS